MNHPHPDIANKDFQYVNIDESFHDFAATQCLCYNAELLLEELEETILLRHSNAIPLQLPDHPRTIWTLANEDLIVRYQILDNVVEVGDLRSKRTGAFYEPAHDLLADFTE